MRTLVVPPILIFLLGCPDSSKPPAPPPPASGTPAAGASDADLPKGTTTYYFGASETKSNVTFTSTTSIMNILGSSNIVQGSATVDFQAGTGSCHLIIPVASLSTNNDDRDRAMRNAPWLEEAKHKTIEFKSEKVTLIERPYRWQITGKFTLKGVARDITVEATVRPIAEAVTQKFQFGDGAWARVKTRFKIKVTDYDMKLVGTYKTLMVDEWPIDIDLYATTKKPDKELVAKLPDDNEIKVVRAKVLKPDGLPGKLYQFGKKTQFTSITARSETPLETIMTATSTIGGYLGLDSEKGAAGVRLTVPVKTLRTGISARDEILLGEAWLDAAKFPHIDFESTKATKKGPGVWSVEGNFTMHGVTKALTVEAKVREVPLEVVIASKYGDKPGLGFVVQFDLKLSDFGVKVPDLAVAKVSDKLVLNMDLVALATE